MVRLKGGDPYVFGRGFEEVLACAEAGVPVTVVPGVTSAFAVPALADVPVTHRGVAHEVVVVSGHVEPGRRAQPGRLAGARPAARHARAADGGGADRRVRRRVLVEHGRPADTPVVVVQDGTLRIQRTLRSTLAEVAGAIAAHGDQPAGGDRDRPGRGAGRASGREIRQTGLYHQPTTREEGQVSELRSLRVDELVDAVAAETPAPGGGAVAAIVTRFAAALTAMAGRYGVAKAEQRDDMLALVARTDELQRSAAPLADLDGELYRALLTALRMPREPNSAARAQAVAVASSKAADVPMRVVQLAAEVAELAAGLAASGNRNLRGDAAAAALLASAAADSAAFLVAENLARMPDDPRLDTAATLAAGPARPRPGPVPCSRSSTPIRPSTRGAIRDPATPSRWNLSPPTSRTVASVRSRRRTRCSSSRRRPASKAGSGT